MNPSNFAALHLPGKPFLLGNAWDAASARAAELAGVKAVGTSSAAIADTLGVPDGCGLTFAMLEPIVVGIRKAVQLPLSVDLEAGYAADPESIARHIVALHRIGVAGVNLEDSVVDPERRLRPCAEFAAILKSICGHLERKRCPMFINVRTDPFVLAMPDALDQAHERASAYASAGADGLFVPGIIAPEDIKTLVGATRLPINVMTVPGLPDMHTLAELGVARVSLGNFVHDRLMRIARETLQCVLTSGRFDHVF